MLLKRKNKYFENLRWEYKHKSRLSDCWHDSTRNILIFSLAKVQDSGLILRIISQSSYPLASCGELHVV